jgi:hypothetical protein
MHCPSGPEAGRAQGPLLARKRQLFAAGAPILGRKFGKAFHKSLSALAALALGLHDAVKLVSQGDAGQHKLHAAAFVKAEAQILDEVVDEEAGGKVALEHAATKGIHGKAAAGTGNHKLHPLGNVKACFLRKEEGFAGADHHASNGGLIGKFALLAKASAAAVQNVGAHLVEAGQYALVSRVVAAHKDGELGIARAHVAAGNRGVQRFAALLLAAAAMRSASTGLEVLMSHTMPPAARPRSTPFRPASLLPHRGDSPQW